MVIDTEAEEIARLSREVSRFKRRAIRRIRRRRERETYYAELDSESEPQPIDPNQRQPDESLIAWWNRAGADQHRKKPWTWF